MGQRRRNTYCLSKCIALGENNLMEVEFEQESLTATGVRFEQRRNFTGAQVIGGAIFEVALDRSHPVNFGIKK